MEYIYKQIIALSLSTNNEVIIESERMSQPSIEISVMGGYDVVYATSSLIKLCGLVNTAAVGSTYSIQCLLQLLQFSAPIPFYVFYTCRHKSYLPKR